MKLAITIMSFLIGSLILCSFTAPSPYYIGTSSMSANKIIEEIVQVKEFPIVAKTNNLSGINYSIGATVVADCYGTSTTETCVINSVLVDGQKVSYREYYGKYSFYYQGETYHFEWD